MNKTKRFVTLPDGSKITLYAFSEMNDLNYQTSVVRFDKHGDRPDLIAYRGRIPKNITSRWQQHPYTFTAHYFETAVPGVKSICKREIFVRDGHNYPNPGVFTCSFCAKLLGEGT